MTATARRFSGTWDLPANSPLVPDDVATLIGALDPGATVTVRSDGTAAGLYRHLLTTAISQIRDDLHLIAVLPGVHVAHPDMAITANPVVAQSCRRLTVDVQHPTAVIAAALVAQPHQTE